MNIPPQAIKELQKILGFGNVCTDEVSLQLGSYDCSLFRQPPDLVLHISHSKIVAPVVRILHQFHIPFIARASATNHAGSCTAPLGGAILNLSALNHILQVNTQEGYVIAEPGVINEQLEQILSPLGFFYAPDPASQAVCTLGGNAAQNASGARGLKYGGTLDHVLEMTVVLPTGETQVFSRLQNGPDWTGVLIGSEGTLGIITQLKVKILPLSKNIKTFLVSFDSLEASVQTVTDLTARGVIPRCVEALDKTTIQAVQNFSHANYPLDAEALLLVELDGSLSTIGRDSKILREVCIKNGVKVYRVAANETERNYLWKGRRSAYSAMAQLAPNVLVCDGTVPRSELPRALKRTQEILKSQHVSASLLFHAGDGNFHPQLIFDERDKVTTQHICRVAKQILQVCIDVGGTISGEHGVGTEKRELMTAEYDKETLTLLREIKQAFDPDNLSNPHKILPLDIPEKARTFAPNSPDVQQKIFQFQAQLKAKKPFQIVGSNTSLKTQKAVFSTVDLNKITDIDLTNYTVTVQSGVTLRQLSTCLLEKHAYSVLPRNGKQTVGGVFSSGEFPEFYAQVIGIQAVLPNGDIVRYGGKLTKNAAGYNLIRLFAGAQGTLGLVTELTFKIYATKISTLTPTPFKPFVPNIPFMRLKKFLDPQNLLLLTTEKTV